MAALLWIEPNGMFGSATGRFPRTEPHIAPGWGNNEQQYYRDDARNLFVGNDRLTIRALRQTSPVQFGQRVPYTSAKIDTRGLFSFCYGKVEFRARCPLGTGLWPAVWMMPEDHVYGPWARSGEIDILEAMGRCPDLVCGTIHYGGPPQNKTEQSHSYRLPIGTTIHDFHTYALLWEPMRLQWYVDGICYSSISTWGSCPGVEPKLSFPQPFDQKFYLIINLAVGGWFDPEANGIVDNTAFPADFENRLYPVFISSIKHKKAAPKRSALGLHLFNDHDSW